MNKSVRIAGGRAKHSNELPTGLITSHGSTLTTGYSAMPAMDEFHYAVRQRSRRVCLLKDEKKRKFQIPLRSHLSDSAYLTLTKFVQPIRQLVMNY